MATVADVLAGKGRAVRSTAPTTTVLAATQLMNRHKIGALVVMEGGRGACSRIVGMFTERDVLTRVVAGQRDPASTLVEEVMSTQIVECRPDTDIDEVASVMREHRIRHVPVCEADGDLSGLISIGDINAWNADRQATTINHLHEYIHGRV